MRKKLLGLGVLLLMGVHLAFSQSEPERKRIRDYGINPGILQTGKWNAITDVQGLKVGQVTLIEGESVRTGVTAILPHEDNIFQNKIPAGVFVGNGFGKLLGTTQIKELGNLETPIVLTNTLNAPKLADGLITYMLNLPGNEKVKSVNAVVGETNDGYLNDIRGRHVRHEDLFKALEQAQSGPVEEGNVGAGTGTMALGFKGGIGTSSRVLPETRGGYTVGVLVQTNFGGILTIDGAPVGIELDNYYMNGETDYKVDGSCMIIIATDAPLSSRNLERLARRSFLAFGKVGSFSSNGSGDYSIAFSTHPNVRIPYAYQQPIQSVPDLLNDDMSPLFLAVVEATEEAIYNSLFKASDISGHNGSKARALPLEETLEILRKHGVIKE